ncbi:MAG: BlaI/MecI/CopY family transcriptional regulator [Oscillospiraceae bacterium]|jgi:BlaI family penicillinase repressor|nr:BlaI/MecI/CopY family transcriptional regulator [Oscillospiraceae bacterium]
MYPKITDAELQMMKIFWRENRVLTFTELRELEHTEGWKKTTVQTVMDRLRKKGTIVEAPGYDRRGDVAHYAPAVSEQAFQLDESETLLDKAFGGSALKMVAALRQGGKLSDDEVAQLRAYFQVEDIGNDD